MNDTDLDYCNDLLERIAEMPDSSFKESIEEKISNLVEWLEDGKSLTGPQKDMMYNIDSAVDRTLEN